MLKILAQLKKTKLGIFEPHDLWFAIRTANMKRYRNLPFAKDLIAQYKTKPAITAIKFAVNPDIEWFSWKLIDSTFDEPILVFIKRNQIDTYASYSKIDAKRGVPTAEIHKWFYDKYYAEWAQFCRLHPERAILLDYDQIVLRNDLSGILGPLAELYQEKINADMVKGVILTPRNRAGPGKGAE